MKKNKNKLLWLHTLIILFVCTNFIHAGETGKIAGKVFDSETGEPVPFANVIIQDTYIGAASDIDGEFIISSIPPGEHTVVITAIGFSKVTVEKVLIRIDLTTRIDAEMTLEAIGLGEVVVQAEQPLITKDLTSTSTIVTSDDIEMMPVDDFNAVVNLQAGVVDGHFRGGRSNEVAYLIDGIAVNDAFSGGLSVEVENSSIRQLEVISGTFNAEYGQAMSGVVNIVTKDGGQKYEGGISAYVGNYFTSDTKIFKNLNNFNLNGPRDFTFNLSGPTKIINGLSFFVTGRYYTDDGFLYGRRIYNTGDTSATISILPNGEENVTYNNTGDSTFVSMNPVEKKSANAKLTYSLPGWKFSYNVFWDDSWNQYYDHGFALAPDGIMNHYRDNLINTFQISFYPSDVTLTTLKFSKNLHEFEGYLFADPFDPNYEEDSRGAAPSEYTFRSGGTQNGRYERYTKTYLGQWTFESQVSKNHKLKLGVEGRMHELFNQWREIRRISLDGEPVELGYSAPQTKFNNSYKVKPYEFSAYIQDKMEYDIMIINAGVRFDLFNSNTTLPSDIRNANNNPLFNGAFQTTKAESEYQISPRFGVSFPMSESGAIHFSYGHFFQIPSFENLYRNNLYLIDQTTTVSTIIGNPELKSQKTVKYELGLQQVLFTNISFDLSIYYSDIRNLMGTEIVNTYDGLLFARFVNRDYGNVKGIVLTLDKRFSHFFSAKVDYTYQVASGNASDPLSTFYLQQSDPPQEEIKKVLPLDWDQSSTLNMSVTIGEPSDWTAGLIFSYGSGLPYTESARFSQGLLFRNGGRKPTTFNLDLRANKNLNLYGLDLNVFLLVYNVLDTRNEYGVSNTTGRAGVDLAAEEFTGTIYNLHTIEDYLINPTDYSMPRQINVGINVGF